MIASMSINAPTRGRAFRWAATLVLWVALALSVYSGIEYAVRYARQVLASSKASKAASAE